MPIRRVARALRVRGHPADPEQLYAADWIRGVLLLIWAVGIGIFIIAGGPDGFQSDTYQALYDTFHRCPKLIGGILTTGGLIGLIGAWFDWRWMSKASCIVCGAWHGMFFGYTFPANLGLFGNTNLISLAMLFIGLLYGVQLLAIWTPPSGKALSP